MADNGEDSLAELRAYIGDLEGQAQSEAALRALQRLAGWASVVAAHAQRGTVPSWPEGEGGEAARGAFESLLTQHEQLVRLLEITRSV